MSQSQETDTQWIRRLAEDSGAESQSQTTLIDVMPSQDSLFSSVTGRRRVWPRGKARAASEGVGEKRRKMDAVEEEEGSKENRAASLPKQPHESAETEDEDEMERGEEEEGEAEEEEREEPAETNALTAVEAALAAAAAKLQQQAAAESPASPPDSPTRRVAATAATAAARGATTVAVEETASPTRRTAAAKAATTAAVEETASPTRATAAVPAATAAAASAAQTAAVVDLTASPTRAAAAATTATAAAASSATTAAVEETEGGAQQTGEEHASQTSSVVIVEVPAREPEEDVPLMHMLRQRNEFSMRLNTVLDMDTEVRAIVRSQYEMLLALTTPQTPLSTWKEVLATYAASEEEKKENEERAEVLCPKEEMSEEDKATAHRRLARLVITKLMENEMREMQEARARAKQAQAVGRSE